MSALPKPIENPEQLPPLELPQVPNFSEVFHQMEAVVEALPERPRVEILRGVFVMSPQPRVRHGRSQGKLYGILDLHLGQLPAGQAAPEWLLVLEPEIKSEVVQTRVVPDICGWKRSTTGWPGPDESLITLVPEWVCEVLSPSTEARDRSTKLVTYGLMGVGWVWLVDPAVKTVETFVNVRGQMKPDRSASSGETLEAAPFEALSIRLDDLFPF